MNPQPSVFADATPMNEFRDAMIPNAPGYRLNSLLPYSFIPHSTASPAAVKAAAAARLGISRQRAYRLLPDSSVERALARTASEADNPPESGKT
jgi:hypothetical protein